MKPALIVVDMQHRFGDCGAPILKNVVALMESFRAKGLPVFTTQHHDPDPQGVLYNWWQMPIEKGSTDWSLLPQIEKAAGTHAHRVTSKTQYDAFIGTELEAELKSQDVRVVVVCGCVTNFCCETTARSAFCRNFHLLFPHDANGAYSPEVHQRSLENIRLGFGPTPDTAAILGALQDAQVGAELHSDHVVGAKEEGKRTHSFERVQQLLEKR
uniref:Isochorismatase-like domain-containing protein n=1 Tax=Chromera velia CCMP2878 TaxID=1169474 RepID=A0A0G4HNN8_9ALVE|mmetsp:Transcript_25991/g.50950  ORF Transcript_25991/g.50950 Transcript_25991/m.50950 type:complete len:213 (-) Transcript_25991:89-727(-)|eukprot:Cvel_7663.t1-p1 / transcript=Cvel_7663.t1 / gene=Cvel_7663 / organism=Chromera_velia_CCMP2878 / gene_product=Isochorismatase family protein YecD, putative / transcript_product=Isochorismatase family protein YecD, putative / location=Cvel_scaffold406:39761-42710(-) / protein_length=212 / sequence_SO=supercontig / SO=protein_coding / is_pseudo=false